MKKLMVGLAALGMLTAAWAEESPALVQIDMSSFDASSFTAGTLGNNNPTAYNNRGPKFAFDGSGLSNGKHVADTADNTMFMFSANNTGAFPWYIQVDLGEKKRLDAVRIYNFNFAKGGNSYTVRGVKNYKLYVSTNPTRMTSSLDITDNYRLIKTGTLAKASGTAEEAGEYIELDEPVNARYFALLALDDYDENFEVMNYNGISEIQLFSGGEPLEEEEEPENVRVFVVDNADSTGVETHGTWKASTSSNDRIGANYIHNSGIPSPDTWVRFTPTLGSNAVYKVSLYWNATPREGMTYDDARSQNVPVEIVYDGGVVTNTVDMSISHGAWFELGNWPFKAGTEGSVCILTEGSATDGIKTPNVIADAVKFAVTDDPITEPEDPVDPPVDPDDPVDPPVDPDDPVDPPVDPEEPPTDIDPIEPGTNLLFEAEAFATKGGWVVDPQFVEQMGSPYLLAHGKGVPVADASVWVNFSAAGRVRAYVRTRDWTPDYDGEKPGRFQLAIGESVFPNTLGVSPATWDWVDAGVVEVVAGTQKLALKDLTGFEGRCDAIFLTSEDNATPPPNGKAELAAWRAEMLGESGAPEDVVEVDYVVVGGGIAGTAAAIAAADAGLSVAIVQDRPMLGGNASDEIRVKTEKSGHEFHWIVNKIKNGPSNGNSMANDDTARQAVCDGYANLQTHLGWRAYGVVTNAERKIVAVDARHVETGARRRFVAPLYCDATGDGWIGYWAGAAYRIGREAKDEYDEPVHGQDTADSSTMGNSLLWTTKTGSENFAFPSTLPWATMVSGNRSDTSGGWQWEAGLDPAEDTIDDAEMLRDRLFRAIYGCFANAKAKAGNENLVFNFFPYIAGKRESRRILGDYVVREKDVTEHRQFEDAIGIATWSVDLHSKDGNSGFLAKTTHYQYGQWWMPYRSLCCRDVPNLFLAGRCASYTHVAFGSSRVMHAGGQQGVAAGYAASLCKKYSCLPREIYQDANKTAELQNLVNAKNEYTWPTVEVTIEHAVAIVDNSDETGVEITGTWPSSSYNADKYGADYLHNNKVASEDLWVRYTPTLTSNATYQVSLFWNGDDSRGDAVPVEITHADGVTTNYVNMTKKSSTWNAIGSWSFETNKTASLTNPSVRILTIGQDGKTVIADAVKFAIVETIESPEDSDQNGLPDAWERRHFLQITGTDPEGDPDGDGRDNLQEYRDGTDPNVADEAPEVVPPYIGGISVEDVRVVLSWDGKEGAVYRVLCAPTLADDFEPIGDPIPGTEGKMSVTLPKGSAPSAFYRIRAE